eukprot:scaffold325777_cov53-Tisochrysis_lutea.AAC.1
MGREATGWAANRSLLWVWRMPGRMADNPPGPLVLAGPSCSFNWLESLLVLALTVGSFLDARRLLPSIDCYPFAQYLISYSSTFKILPSVSIFDLCPITDIPANL